MCRSELIDSLKGVSGIITVADDYRRILIDFIEDYGILQSYTVNSETIFELPKTYYTIGVQPFFDYLLAMLITNQIQEPSEVTLTEPLLCYKGALQMIAIFLLEDYSYLISENKSFRDSLNDEELFDLVCFALSNVSPSAAAKYISLVERMMNYNSDSLKTIVNKIILPVARIENHPLGAQMLHEYLMGYKTAAKRDIIWSVPSYLRCQENVPWEGYTTINLKDKRYELSSEDKYNGIPLVYAWMLTTVNNIERVDYRRELMKWASKQPYEFFKLFEQTYKTNDPQMVEELFALAMGTVFMIVRGHPCIKLFSDWMIKNVFASDKISMYYSCATRYYSRAIVERAYVFNIVNEEEVHKCRPPYHTTGTIPLNREATAGTRMGGFRPITYDLARYVLCDPIDRMFFSRYGRDETDKTDDLTWYFSENEIEQILSNQEIIINKKCKAELTEALSEHKKKGRFLECLDDLIDEDANAIISNKKSAKYIYNKEADNLLLKHASILHMESLKPNQFVLSAAYAYILLQGWNKEEFYGLPNGGKAGEVIGVDIAILREHHAATHGSKSGVMTFAEKYTWCARNQILGYLSDRLKFRDFERVPSFLDDYGLLDDFLNPSQELYQEKPGSIMERNSWFIPEMLSPLINEGMGEEAIRSWIINAPIPNFEKWINITNFNHEIAQEYQKDWISLYSFNSLSNTLGGESLMWISSAIITKQNFKYLMNDIINGKESLIYNLCNPEHLHSSTETQCYITPKEICWMNWKNECYNKIKEVTIDDGDFVEYSLKMAVEQCTANYPEYGDVYYKLPSRTIRELLGICDGDGYKYYNGEKQLEAFFFEAGEKWYDSQSYLCVDREKLLSQLEHHNFQIFWTVRLLREATSKSLEKYPNLHIRNDECWLAWFEDGEFKIQMFQKKLD